LPCGQRVVRDPESFRHAGSRVFSEAQYRMEVIARTEVLRAHNQGRIKFDRRVGVRKLELKHHIGPLKNKQQLIRALQKAAGEELAEKAKQGEKSIG